MIKLNKNVKWIIIVVLSIAAVVGIIWLTITSLIPPNKEKMEKYFQRDKDDLKIIADYLGDLDYSYVTIDKSGVESGQMFTGANTRYQKIGDETVMDSLKRLLKNKKYKVVGKNNNTIFFQKWRFLEKDRGIAVDEDGPILVEFLIKSEPLSETGWYYYESDYEEYRN